MDQTIYRDFMISFHSLYREEKKIDFIDRNKTLHRSCYPSGNRVRAPFSLSLECISY